MKTALTISIFLCLLFPALLAAQKAYDVTYYKATFKGDQFVFRLANGYLGASKISIRDKKTKRATQYRPASAKANKRGQLRFTSTATANRYFVLNDLKEDYDELPSIIKSTFYISGRPYQIVFAIYQEPSIR